MALYFKICNTLFRMLSTEVNVNVINLEKIILRCFLKQSPASFSGLPFIFFFWAPTYVVNCAQISFCSEEFAGIIFFTFFDFFIERSAAL